MAQNVRQNLPFLPEILRGAQNDSYGLLPIMSRKTEIKDAIEKLKKLKILQQKAVDKLEKIREKSVVKPAKKKTSPAKKKQVKPKPTLKKKPTTKIKNRPTLKKKPATKLTTSKATRKRTSSKTKTKAPAPQRPVLRHFFR